MDAKTTPAAESTAAEYDEALAILCAAMRFKLVLNRHKGDLSQLEDDALLDKLRLEVGELDDAIDTGGRDDIILECADVANFALAIAMRAVRAKMRRPNGDCQP